MCANVVGGFRTWDEVSAELFPFPREWHGKRRVSLCATVPWRRQPSGRKARKAAFAANARKCRKWMANYKRECLASGRYVERSNAPNGPGELPASGGSARPGG